MNVNDDVQQNAVMTLGKAIAIIRDARMTVTGATVENVADACRELRELERNLAFSVYELNAVADMSPPGEGDEDDLNTI